jgi:hypothetical protein
MQSEPNSPCCSLHRHGLLCGLLRGLLRSLLCGLLRGLLCGPLEESCWVGRSATTLFAAGIGGSVMGTKPLAGAHLRGLR